MLEKQINDAGGVNGKKLKIVILDDGAKPAQAANDLRKLAGDDKVLAVAGPLTSSAAEVTFPVANEIENRFDLAGLLEARRRQAANRPWAFRNTIDEGILGRKRRCRISKRRSTLIPSRSSMTPRTLSRPRSSAKIMPAVFKADGDQGGERERSRSRSIPAISTSARRSPRSSRSTRTASSSAPITARRSPCCAR